LVNAELSISKLLETYTYESCNNNYTYESCNKYFA